MTESVPTVVTILGQKNVERITIVDDAYDPLSLRSVPKAALEEFWGEIQDSSDLQKELVTVGIAATKLEELTDAALQVIYEKQESLQGLKEHAKKMLFEVIKARSEVDIIKSNLEQLKLTVTLVGSAEATIDRECKIFFLDYYLGPFGNAAEAEESVKMAVARAKEIYSQYSGSQPRPIIVLMSSQELSTSQVEDFRKNSSLLGGMFHHIPKSHLTDKDALQRKLLAVARSLPVAHAIEALIAAVERSVQSAQDQFFASMRGLSIEDYIYVQQLSLKEDGQPFGDYLLWLFSSDLQRRVFEAPDVEQKQQAVDELPMLELPPRQFKPSTELAEMYKSSLFRRMPAEVQSHPLSTAEQDYPLLALGDIFVDDKRNLYAVLNPACDLAYSPASKGRDFSSRKSVVLIPGSLHPLSKTVPPDLVSKPRTEFFVHENHTYRIIWDTKRIITREYGKMREWINSEKLRREYRLRLLYALQIQQEFTADFGRVGPPIAPPIFDPVRVEVYGYDEKGKIKLLLGPLEDDAALVTSAGTTKCALALSFLEQFCTKIGAARQGIEARITDINGKLTALEQDAGESSTGEPMATPKDAVPGANDAKTGNNRTAIPNDQQRQKLMDRIERCRSHLATVDEFDGDKIKQMELISEPLALPEPGSSSTLESPKGLFHIYHDKEVQANYQVAEAFILKISSIQ